MGNTIPDVSLKTILPISAVAASGLTSGFLSAATFMDVPTFKQLIANKDSDTIKKVFAIWWPYGGQFMIPMTILNFVAHFGSYAVTKEKLWILSGCFISANLPYTGILMKEGIQTLRTKKDEMTDDEVFEVTNSFCNLHQPRLFFALFAFGTSLYLITKKV
jgi:hypothetical protein